MTALKNKASKLFDDKYDIIIAVDGPSASGKGTISKAIAEKHNLLPFSSGILFRALAAKLVENKLYDLPEDSQLTRELCNSLDFENLPSSMKLQASEIAELASKISKSHYLRDLLYWRYRDYLQNFRRIIVDGRDVGSKLFPEADIKLYLEATAEARAERRARQLNQSGSDVTYEEILQFLKDRDERDSSREYSPLKPATDAIILDNSGLNVQQTLEKFEKSVKNADA